LSEQYGTFFPSRSSEPALYPYPEPYPDPEFVRSGTEKPGKRENVIYVCENKDEKEKNRHSFLPVVYIPFF
jgi:hypothetical protein